MNPSDILKYGQRTVMQALDAFPQTELETPGACGYWSVKDILAHLTSYERVLVDVLTSFVIPGAATPNLEKMGQQGAQFNDNEVDLRKARAVPEVLAEFNDAHRQSLALAAQIPTEVFARPGTLPWYGLEYSLDDYIVYAFYGHKREHSAQIAAFGDVLERGRKLMREREIGGNKQTT